MSDWSALEALSSGSSQVQQSSEYQNLHQQATSGGLSSSTSSSSSDWNRLIKSENNGTVPKSPTAVDTSSTKSSSKTSSKSSSKPSTKSSSKTSSKSSSKSPLQSVSEVINLGKNVESPTSNKKLENPPSKAVQNAPEFQNLSPLAPLLHQQNAAGPEPGLEKTGSTKKYVQIKTSPSSTRRMTERQAARYVRDQFLKKNPGFQKGDVRVVSSGNGFKTELTSNGVKHQQEMANSDIASQFGTTGFSLSLSHGGYSGDLLPHPQPKSNGSVRATENQISAGVGRDISRSLGVSLEGAPTADLAELGGLGPSDFNVTSGRISVKPNVSKKINKEIAANRFAAQTAMPITPSDIQIKDGQATLTEEAQKRIHDQRAYGAPAWAHNPTERGQAAINSLMGSGGLMNEKQRKAFKKHEKRVRRSWDWGGEFGHWAHDTFGGGTPTKVARGLGHLPADVITTPDLLWSAADTGVRVAENYIPTANKYGGEFTIRAAGGALGESGTNTAQYQVHRAQTHPVEVLSETLPLLVGPYAIGKAGEVVDAANEFTFADHGPSTLNMERFQRFRPGGPTSVAGGETLQAAGPSEPLGSPTSGILDTTSQVDKSLWEDIVGRRKKAAAIRNRNLAKEAADQMGVEYSRAMSGKTDALDRIARQAMIREGEQTLGSAIDEALNAGEVPKGLELDVGKGPATEGGLDQQAVERGRSAIDESLSRIDEAMKMEADLKDVGFRESQANRAQLSDFGGEPSTNEATPSRWGITGAEDFAIGPAEGTGLRSEPLGLLGFLQGPKTRGRATTRVKSRSLNKPTARSRSKQGSASAVEPLSVSLAGTESTTSTESLSVASALSSNQTAEEFGALGFPGEEGPNRRRTPTPEKRRPPKTSRPTLGLGLSGSSANAESDLAVGWGAETFAEFALGQFGEQKAVERTTRKDLKSQEAPFGELLPAFTGGEKAKYNEMLDFFGGVSL